MRRTWFLLSQKRLAVVHRRHLSIRRVELLQRFYLAKEIVQDAHQPVATSSIGLGFRSFHPIASQSIPPASSSLFLSEDDLPPRNQLEAPQIVIPDTMLPGSSSTMQLSEVMLALSTMQVSTVYAHCESSAVRTPAFSIPRRRWSSYHPSVMHGRRATYAPQETSRHIVIAFSCLSFIRNIDETK